MDNNCDENTIIEYSNINNKLHTCKNNNVYKLKKNIKLKEDDIKILLDIITTNPLETSINIKQKLKEKNIILNDNTINHYLYKVRNEKYIDDNTYLKLLYKEQIKFNIDNDIIKEKFFHGEKTVFNIDKDRIEN